MIFSDIYPKPVAGMILDGSKCQTRRLVKKGEGYYSAQTGELSAQSIFKEFRGRGLLNSYVSDKNDRVKWQVGRDYAVQLGRGKPGVLVCPKSHEHDMRNILDHCDLTPLRIVINSIRKERLLDITEVDAKKEGFDSKAEFIVQFNRINRNKKSKGTFKDALKEFTKRERIADMFWNPFVWVLDFKVKEVK